MDYSQLFEIGAMLATVVASGAVARYQLGETRLLAHSNLERITQIEKELALVGQKQNSHQEQIDGIVEDLKRAVSDLQKIALDLASMPKRRN